MGGGAETMYTQITFIFSKKKQYGYILSIFINQKNEKNKKLKFVNETCISTVPKVLFFKTTDLNIVYLFSKYADN